MGEIRAFLRIRPSSSLDFGREYHEAAGFRAASDNNKTGRNT
jgi:hypothetical protein